MLTHTVSFLSLLLFTYHISILSDDWALHNNRAVNFLCSDGPPQSCGFDHVIPASILLEVWAPSHLLLQLQSGSISGLCKAPDLQSREILSRRLANVSLKYALAWSTHAYTDA